MSSKLATFSIHEDENLNDGFPFLELAVEKFSVLGDKSWGAEFREQIGFLWNHRTPDKKHLDLIEEQHGSFYLTIGKDTPEYIHDCIYKFFQKSSETLEKWKLSDFIVPFGLQRNKNESILYMGNGFSIHMEIRIPNSQFCTGIPEMLQKLLSVSCLIGNNIFEDLIKLELLMTSWTGKTWQFKGRFLDISTLWTTVGRWSSDEVSLNGYIHKQLGGFLSPKYVKEDSDTEIERRKFALSTVCELYAIWASLQMFLMCIIPTIFPDRISTLENCVNRNTRFIIYAFLQTFQNLPFSQDQYLGLPSDTRNLAWVHASWKNLKKFQDHEKDLLERSLGKVPPYFIRFMRKFGTPIFLTRKEYCLESVPSSAVILKIISGKEFLTVMKARCTDLVLGAESIPETACASSSDSSSESSSDSSSDSSSGDSSSDEDEAFMCRRIIKYHSELDDSSDSSRESVCENRSTDLESRDQLPSASSTPNDVVAQENETSEECIIIHDDALVADLQDDSGESLEKLEEYSVHREKPRICQRDGKEFTIHAEHWSDLLTVREMLEQVTMSEIKEFVENNPDKAISWIDAAPAWGEELGPYSFRFGRAKWYKEICSALKTARPDYQIRNDHQKKRVRRKRKWNGHPK